MGDESQSVFSRDRTGAFSPAGKRSGRESLDLSYRLHIGISHDRGLFFETVQT